MPVLLHILFKKCKWDYQGKTKQIHGEHGFQHLVKYSCTNASADMGDL